jgi:streptogramin lyase
MKVRLGSIAATLLIVALALPAIAQAKAGDILAALDGADDAVVRITKSGNTTTVASGSPLTAPSGLDFSIDGRIFEADYELPGIVEINPRTGAASVLNEDPDLFSEPLDLEFGPDKKIYVAEEGEDTVVRVNPKTGDASVFASDPEMNDPYALSISPKGTIFVAEDDGQILRVDKQGDVSIVAEVAGAGFEGIEQTPKGLLYAMDSTGGVIYSVDPRTGATDEVAEDSAFGGSYNIALEPRGTLVVATNGPDVLRADPRTGAVTVVPGGEGVAAEGIAVEPPKCKGKLATIVGSQKRDKLKGSTFGDVIVGLKGNDKISGGKGKDLICGGKGKDKLKGGKGRDKLDGGPGKDREQQ